MKKTPLYQNHCKLRGKIIDFGGWALPVQYTGIIEEHERVRNAAGLFDVSHMGEIEVMGKDAAKMIQLLVTNDISKTQDGQVVYSPMCYPDGGVVDDLLIYQINPEHYLLVVNASNTDKDFEWIVQNLNGDVKAENVSDRYAQLALQGPNAQAILQKLTDFPLDDIRFFRFAQNVKTGTCEALISRSGYTGEDGFEIYMPSEDASGLWEDILEAGSDEGLLPIGLGARDTLRFEAALPLYGHEISQDISPLEAGLDNFVKLNKDDFIGKQALYAQKEHGVTRRLTGFEMVERGIPRNGYEVQVKADRIGFVTTGSFSPTLKKNIGLAMIDSASSKENTEIDIIIRDKPVKAKIIKIPFYTKKYKL